LIVRGKKTFAEYENCFYICIVVKFVEGFQTTSIKHIIGLLPSKTLTLKPFQFILVGFCVLGVCVTTKLQLYVTRIGSGQFPI
jgi:hypothetical protein